MTAHLDFDKQFQPDISAWVLWPAGEFDVRLKYLSVSAAERLVKDCQVTEFDPRTHQRQERLDDEKFKKKIADLVTDWRGLTAAKAKKFVSLNHDTPDDGEFPCTTKHKLFVISNFSGFPSFVLDSAKALHQINEEAQRQEEKN